MKKMKATAIMTRTRMVNSRGRRLRLLSAHSAFHSSERFFFIIMARRNGEMSSTVTSPVMRFPQTSRVSPGNKLCINGSPKVNITAMVAAVRME